MHSRWDFRTMDCGRYRYDIGRETKRRREEWNNAVIADPPPPRKCWVEASCDWCGWWGWVGVYHPVPFTFRLIEHPWDSSPGPRYVYSRYKPEGIYCMRCACLEEPPWSPNNRVGRKKILKYDIDINSEFDNMNRKITMASYI